MKIVVKAFYYLTLDTMDVYGFDGNKCNPLRRIPLDATVMTKSLTINFFRMDESPYDAIIGRDWTIPVEAIDSSKYQFMKFPHIGRIIKI